VAYLFRFWTCFHQPHESKCTIALWNWPHRSSPFLYRSPCIIILETHKIVMIVMMMILPVVALIFLALINSPLQHQTQRQSCPCPIGAQRYDKLKKKEGYIFCFRRMLQWWSRCWNKLKLPLLVTFLHRWAHSSCTWLCWSQAPSANCSVLMWATLLIILT